MKWSITGRHWRIVALPFAVVLIVAVNAAFMARASGVLAQPALDMPTINDPDGCPQPGNDSPLVDFDCWAWDHVAGCSRDSVLE